MVSESTLAALPAAQLEKEARQIMVNMDKPVRRTIRAAEYISVKKSIPKTLVGHTIIHENPSQDRLLDLELERIGYRRSCFLSSHEISRRTFLEQQTRKERKWKSQDEMRLSGMNFPLIRGSAVSGRASVEVIYKSPKYKDGEDMPTQNMLPYMQLRRERTEFIRQRGVISTTRLPTVIEIDALKFKRYNTFCGNDFKKIKNRKVQKDKKFLSLIDSLSPMKVKGEATSDDERDRRPHYESDHAKPWYMSDSDSDDSVDEAPPQSRGVSRDSTRKAVVVFPSVASKRGKAAQQSKPQDKYAAPIAEDKPSAIVRSPQMDPRAHTQYQLNRQSMERLNANIQEPSDRKPPQTAPDGLSTNRSNATRKVVSLSNAPSTQLEDINAANQPTKPVKGILKTPSSTKRPKSKESASVKREKIKKDIQRKDLRDLKEKYGTLKGASGNGEGRSVKDKDAPDVREEENGFHSPTLERRFHVKSGLKRF